MKGIPPIIGISDYGVCTELNLQVYLKDEGQPYDTPMPIMGKVAAYSLQHVGISLDLVKDTIREAGAWIKQKYLPEGYFNCATF
tara:strand:+ start:319 stop:570 length:252 start_codon:yes stop_codon:yes gene_type:complete